ncbi:hypothetical protein [Streptomyces lavendofoliae]|uniref:Uncharacterized protein n=2 Tax=Streptomyces TaxID=1883 RepID=A0A918I399_9ACTN|nr:hypothetical protein [Streptomyces lavendofoliae]GGU62395.1 hypothetical protein GCM10010274_58970 [Streptomyces lavendofoliae]
MIREERIPLDQLTPEQLAALYDQIDKLANPPALRNCLVPGCLKQYDAMACMAGETPARPEWSGTGWHTLGSGSIFPAGGHICPDHTQLATGHMPRRVKLTGGRWTIDCGCGWTPTPQRWHGVLGAMWEQHVLTVTGTLPEAPPQTDPEHRTPLADLTEDTLAELYDRLWDAEDEVVQARDAGRAMYLAYESWRRFSGEQGALLSGVHSALWSLRHNLAHDSRDWAQDWTDAWLYALIIGWDCEQQHQHGDDCPAALDEIAAKHEWTPARLDLARKHRGVLAQAGPNGETDAQAARTAAADTTEERTS